MFLELILKLFKALFGGSDGSTPETKPVTKDPTPWLSEAKKLLGTYEYQGSADNQAIIAWPKEIGDKYPDLASYSRAYNHDSIPWCGLFVALCCTRANVKPQYGSTDVERYLWAQAWRLYGQDLGREAAVGAIAVLAGHVAFVAGKDQYGNIMLLGGNQSDAVNIKPFKRSSIQYFRWPPGYTIPDLSLELPIINSDGSLVTKVT